MTAPRDSRAYGKRFGDTKVPISRSQAELGALMTRYAVPAHQWTALPGKIEFRMKLPDPQGKNRQYLFTLDQYEDDPQENRRLLRVLVWFLDTMLAAEEAGIFGPNQTLLGFQEMAPGVTVAGVLDDPKVRAAIRCELGGGILALGPAE